MTCSPRLRAPRTICLRHANTFAGTFLHPAELGDVDMPSITLFYSLVGRAIAQ